MLTNQYIVINITMENKILYIKQLFTVISKTKKVGKRIFQTNSYHSKYINNYFKGTTVS